jgi:hypothetical protein
MNALVHEAILMERIIESRGWVVDSSLMIMRGWTWTGPFLMMRRPLLPRRLEGPDAAKK